MMRAIWLIKMTSAYSMAISEAKMKKRQVPDSSQGYLVPLTIIFCVAALFTQSVIRCFQSGHLL